MIKEVSAPDWNCDGCVYDGTQQCFSQICGSDTTPPIKFIEVTD